MNVNLVLAQFNELTDSEAMLLLFKNLKSVIVDNDDIILVDEEVLQVKSEAGNIVVDVEELNGFKVLNKADVVKYIISKMLGD